MRKLFINPLNNIVIRHMRMRDIISLDKMYDCLSEKSKRFFHPGFLGLRPTGLSCFLAQILLALSTVRAFRRKLMYVCPRGAYLPIVALNERNEVIAFAFLDVKKRLGDQGLIAEVGVAVEDKHQGKGVGSKLMKKLTEVACEENVTKLFANVMTDNVKSIRLFENFGFKERRVVKYGDSWSGHGYDYVEMWLDLS